MLVMFIIYMPKRIFWVCSRSAHVPVREMTVKGIAEMAYKPVIAALRVLDVLAAVSKTTGEATVGKIHRLTGLDKATIVRMLYTLTHAGYVVRDSKTQTYRVTGKTLQLSVGYNRHQTIGAIVSEDLTQFRQSIGWPSDVSIFDEEAMLVIETSREAEPMRFFRKPGYRAPMLYTSLGRAYLAFCPEEERQAFLQSAQENPAPEFALSREPDALEALLETVRAQGYATMDESYSSEYYDSQFFSIGVPIRSQWRVFGAMNIIYLRQTMRPDEARDQFLGALTDVADRLAAKLEAHSGDIN